MGYGGSDPSTDALFGTPVAMVQTKVDLDKPVTTIKKGIGHVAGGSDANQLLSISKTDSTSSTKSSDPKVVMLKNTGTIPVIAMLGYESYTTEAADGVVHYLHVLLKPGEELMPPMRGIIHEPSSAGDALHVLDGTTVDFTAPSNTLYIDTTVNLGANVSATTDPITITTGANGTNYFRVGDLIQLGQEIATANNYQEILRVKSITDTENMVCERALYGTDAGNQSGTNYGVGHASGSAIYFPTFNCHQTDSDRFSTVQTDGSGNYSIKNMFNLGRSTSDVPVGITPGSFVVKFYEPGYQNLTNDGDITPSTHSGLSANTTYYLSLSIDGGTTDAVTFTTDGSNLNFGGSNGIISKLQAMADALFYNPDKNNYNKKCTFEIVDGDLRCTSGQHLSTSAISITTNTAGTTEVDELFDGQTDGTGDIGRFKAVIPSAVAARLPDDVVYDPITYGTSPNTSQFAYDDGEGNIIGKCRGDINYETGAFNLRLAPRMANFEYSVIHSGPFSGKIDSSEANRANQLVAVHANVLNKKVSGEMEVKTF